MKSKLFKQHKKNLENEVDNEPVDDEEDYNTEVDYGESAVSDSKSNKLAIIAASALLVTAVIYFLFFNGQQTELSENLEELTIGSTALNPTSSLGSPASQPTDLIDSVNEEENVLLDQPKLPEVPALPDIPQNMNIKDVILPKFLDVPKKQQKKEEKKLEPLSEPLPEPISDSSRDSRRSKIIVETVGQSSGILERDDLSGGIIVLNQNPINDLKRTQNSVIPTVIQNKGNTIAQGKMMTAILETAINTEIPGTIRGIISRDVYAESGNNVLIPKGSRLYGTYSTQIVRGQGRVEINWSRLLRPDGVDLQIGFVASDQFGRSGIEGETDNKYGTVLFNSLLTSVLAVGGALAVEQLSDNPTSTTTTDPTTGTSTTTSSAATDVITDVTKTIVDTVGNIVKDSINVTPVIRVPQGTRITIIVNQDMTIPTMKN